MADLDITGIIKRHKGAIVTHEAAERHHLPALGDRPAITFQSPASINIKLLCPTQALGDITGTTLLRAVVDKFMAMPGARLVNSDELAEIRGSLRNPFAVVEMDGKQYHIQQLTHDRVWSRLENEIQIFQADTGQVDRQGSPQELADANREMEALAGRLGLDPDLKPREILPDGTVKYPEKVIAPDSDKEPGCPAASLGHITPTRVALTGNGEKQETSRNT